MAVTVKDLLEDFACLHANDDARQVVQAALLAFSLPENHPLAHVAPFGEGVETLVRFAKLRAGMNVERLQFHVLSLEAQHYSAIYVHQFVRAVRQELMAHLHAEALPLLPEASQRMAWRTIEALEETLSEVARVPMEEEECMDGEDKRQAEP